MTIPFLDVQHHLVAKVAQDARNHRRRDAEHAALARISNGYLSAVR